MNTRKPRPLTPCKLPGQTRADYDYNIAVLKSLGKPRLRITKLPGLDINGLPGAGGDTLADAVKRLGASAFASGLYQKPERPKTEAREKARRLRQRGVTSA